jgi:hypothetical protein
MEEIAEIRALENFGLEGCAHARTDSPRQARDAMPGNRQRNNPARRYHRKTLLAKFLSD